MFMCARWFIVLCGDLYVVVSGLGQALGHGALQVRDDEADLPGLQGLSLIDVYVVSFACVHT